MKKYYLLELIPDNGRIISNKLHKTEFTSPFCIINILLKDIENVNKINFVLTNNVYYLIDFVYIKTEEEFEDLCAKFYNKGNFMCGNVTYFLTGEKKIYTELTSKNFDKYYSYNSLDVELENYNVFTCEIDYIREYFAERFLVKVEPLFVLSPHRSNKKYIESITNAYRYLFTFNVFKFKQFKIFNTFRELVLHCIELYRNQFFPKYKRLFNKEEELIINEYYDILEDVAKGIEL